MHVAMYAWLLAVPSLTAQTFIVDAAGGPGSHYKDLAKAVERVPDGAVLRVRTGTYPTPFFIAHKSLTIIGDSRTGVRITGRVEIGPQRASDRVLLANLTVTGQLAPHLVVKNTIGAVVLHEVNADTQTSYATAPLHVIERSANVHVVKSTLRGWTEFLSSSIEASSSSFYGLDGATPLRLSISPTPAIRMKGGRLQLASTLVQGGAGTRWTTCQFPTIPGTPGAAGIHAEEGASITLLGGSCTGGAGSPKGSGCFRGYDGGAGIVLRSSKVLAAGTVISGGAGGVGANNGPPVAKDASSSAVLQPKALPPDATVLGNVARSANIQISVTARPGSLALLLLGLQTTMQPLEPIGVGHLLCAPALVLGQFVVPGNGTLSLPVTIPKDWVLDLPVYGQFLTLEVSAQNVLWGSNLLVLLAPSPSR